MNEKIRKMTNEKQHDVLVTKLHGAFDAIEASDELKENTYTHLQKTVYAKPDEHMEKVAPKSKRRRPLAWRLAPAFASFILVAVVGFFSFNLYFEEVAAIDIDVNPSIELKLNRLDRVVGVYAYNEDGQKVLDAVDVRNMTYDEALRALIEQMVEMGYLDASGLFSATLQAAENAHEQDMLAKINQN
jgi:hypothetical protein